MDALVIENSPKSRPNSYTEPPSPSRQCSTYQGPSDGAVCIILAAGFSQLEQDLAKLGDDKAGTPKALLPVGGKPMLDHWWGYISQNRSISDTFVVCNALNYKHFERWATAKGIHMSRVVNNGVTAPKHARGVLRDVMSGLQRARLTLGNSMEDRDVIIFAGDTLFFKDFDLDRILRFRLLKQGSLLLYYKKRDTDKAERRGLCQVDSDTHQVLAFTEKPAPNQRGSDFPCVTPLFYILEPTTWKLIGEFVSSTQRRLDTAAAEEPQRQAEDSLRRSLSAPPMGPTPSMSTQTKPAIVGCEPFSFGRFVEYAIETRKAPFWGMRMPGAFFLVGQGAGLEEYRQMDSCFANPEGPNSEPRRVKTGAYARVGLMGNPSDGFNGKTISFTVKNFWASVELWESEHLRLLPHPLYDPSTFSGLEDLHFIGRREGYYGGTRLLMATCKRFQELCTTNGIALPRKNFTVKYDTNIPRQVGLAGSSAIVTSLFSALMQFYDLSVDDIPLEKQPSFVLSVESELGIQAGLQDRVVQVYRGLVFMDFAADYMSEHGHGDYQRLPEDVFDWLCTLPFFIAYEADPSDSGKIHSNVRSRWDAGDAEVIEGMKHFAQLTVQAKDALLRRDHSTLADLMDENFTTRRRIYGDACLGAKNLRMIEICKSLGAAAKFPGSGGAVLGLCRPRKPSELAPPSSLQQVREALESENFVFCPLDPVICPLEMI